MMFMPLSKEIRRAMSFRALLTVVALASADPPPRCRPAPPATPAVTVTADTYAVVNGRQSPRRTWTKPFSGRRPRHK